MYAQPVTAFQGGLVLYEFYWLEEVFCIFTPEAAQYVYKKRCWIVETIERICMELKKIVSITSIMNIYNFLICDDQVLAAHLQNAASG